MSAKSLTPEPAADRVWMPFPDTLTAAETPVDRLVACFDGKARAASEFFGITEKTLYRWRRPKSKGGKGGGIPAYRVKGLIERAEAAGLPLTREMLGHDQ